MKIGFLFAGQGAQNLGKTYMKNMKQLEKYMIK